MQGVDVGIRGDERLLLRLRCGIALGRMQDACDAAVMLNKPEGWHALADAAAHTLDIPLALECAPSTDCLITLSPCR